MTHAALNNAISGFQSCNAIVQFEIDFARHYRNEIERLRNVPSVAIRLEYSAIVELRH